MERWNGIVEWATMTNDPVPHQTYSIERAHYAAQLEQSQKGDREEYSQGYKLAERQRL